MEEKENAVKVEETKEVPSEEASKTTPNPEESDFADEIKKPEPAPEPVKEEPKKEEGVELYLEKEEEKETPSEAKEPEAEVENKKEEKKKGEKKGKPAPVVYQYDDDNLRSIEDARLAFSKDYKKSNLWKWVVTIACLVVIVAGWLVTTIPEVSKAFSSVNENFPTIFTLILVGISLVALLVFSSIFKKDIDKKMKTYFAKFYEYQNAYIFPESCENLKGSVDSKLDESKLKECGIYKDIAKIGSRACYEFDYQGHHVVMSDAAAQTQDKKALRTVFVGKFAYFQNNYVGEDILIYFKGNKRALPPTNLVGRNLYKDSKTMVIYGPVSARKVLTHDVQMALSKFDTNKTFVDMAISIKEGMTYIAMGFEDDLMVLPLEKPFNPMPTKEAKKDIAEVLDLITAFDGKENL